MHLRRFSAVAIATLIATSAHAVTYVVSSDRNLVRRADAIVIATAVESHAIFTSVGGIATVTTFASNDVIKGTPSQFEVTEPGGAIDGRMMFVPGAPRFTDGARYLLFLHRTPDGLLTTYGLGLGKFDFTTDVRGRKVIARGSLDATLGWDEQGAPYVERLRDAGLFLDFVRAVAKNPDAPVTESYQLPNGEALAHFVLRPAPNATRGDYLFSSKVRWNNNATATFNYCCAPNLQPAPFDGPGAASTAASQWNGTGVIHYTIGTVTTANKGLTQSDGNNGVLFNDPNNELAAFGVGVVALGGFTNTGATYTLGGESFVAITEADVVVGKNAQFPAGVSQALFAAVLTHEMGHTLGFRHADGTGNASSPPPACSAPSPCSFGGQAIMESLVARTTLGTWDTDAAQTVYGAAPVCNNPVITAQPQSTSITSGGTTLSVTATGTNPAYQWFQGSPGSGITIAGATGSTLFVSPATTTSYFVVVSACATSVTSNTATVTVNAVCGASADDLCLNGARYRVTLRASDPSGKAAQGVPIKQSNLFGYFSLPGLSFDASRPEVFVKTVGPVNGVPWVFYAGLTNLDYNVTVTDTQGSFNETYHVVAPPSGSFQSFGNFDVAGATSLICADVAVSSSTGSPSSCAATSSALCLLNRFSLTLQARDNPTRSNNSGPGATVAVNNEFGFFTTPALAPDPSDIQVFVKMVDARSFNGKFWVFLGGLTDFEFTVTVRDTQTGATKTYKKSAGSTCGWNDTLAF